MTRERYAALASASRQHVRLAREIAEARARLYGLAARCPLQDRADSGGAEEDICLDEQRGLDPTAGATGDTPNLALAHAILEAYPLAETEGVNNRA